MPPGIRRLAFYVPKGGVGKTTSAAHIGVSAAVKHDLDVVLIDLAGAQNDLANHFDLSIADTEDEADERDSVIDARISAAFSDHWDTIASSSSDLLSRFVFETGEGPDLIPADAGLGGADNNLANVSLEDRFGHLEQFVRDTLIDEYDLVVFDLPGTENNIALNGLFAATNVIAPVRPGKFERDQLQSLEDDLDRIREDAGHDVAPHLRMVIPTMVGQTRVSREFLEDLEATYPDRLAPPVAKSQSITNQQDAGRTMYAVEMSDLYDTGQRARKAYSQITDELLDTIEPR